MRWLLGARDAIWLEQQGALDGDALFGLRRHGEARKTETGMRERRRARGSGGMRFPFQDASAGHGEDTEPPSCLRQVQIVTRVKFSLD